MREGFVIIIWCQELVNHFQYMLDKYSITTAVPSGLPGVSGGKESTCNAGDLHSIPDGEDPLEKGMETHASILAWRIHKDRGAWWTSAHGAAKNQMQLSD